MNRTQVVKIFKFRKSILNNIDNILSKIKSSNNNDLSSQGQLDLFSQGLKVEKEEEVPEYDGKINIMEFVDYEKELLGLPVTYNPLNDLEIFNEIYCNYKPEQLLNFDTNNDNITILDRIVDIEYQVSNNSGNRYAKIYISELSKNLFFYLNGERYKKFIAQLYINEFYLIKLNYSEPTKKFPRDSFSITKIKNIKDVNIESKIKELKEKRSKVQVMDRNWIETNKPEWL